jgi:hypothetical protein
MCTIIETISLPDNMGLGTTSKTSKYNREVIQLKKWSLLQLQIIF